MALFLIILYVPFPSNADESQSKCLPVIGFKIEYDEADSTLPLPLSSITIKDQTEDISKDLFPEFVYGFTEDSEDAIKIYVADWIKDQESSNEERIVYLPEFDSTQYGVADDALLPYCIVYLTTNENSSNPEPVQDEEPVNNSDQDAVQDDANDPEQEDPQNQTATPAPEPETTPEPSQTPTEPVETPEPTETPLPEPTQDVEPEQSEEPQATEVSSEEPTATPDTPEDKQDEIETPAPEEPVLSEPEYDVQSFTVGNVSLTGLMPKNAEVSVKDVNKTVRKNVKSEKSAAATATDTTAATTTTVIASYDISITADGIEYQPDEEHPIHVEILCDSLQDDMIISLQHIKDDGSIEEIVDFSINDKSICFDAYGFSIYQVVVAPAPAPADGYTDLTYGDDITAHQVRIDVNGYYFTNTWWVKSGRNLIKKTSANQSSNAALYRFEAVSGQQDQYYVYTIVNNERQYVVLQSLDNDRGGLSLSANASEATPFSIEKWNNSDSYFQIYGYANGKKYYWNMQGGNSGNGFAAYKTQNDVNGKLHIAYLNEMPDDPYDLDGKTYGMVYANTNTSGISISSQQKQKDTRTYLEGESVLYRTDAIYGSNSLYVAYDSDIAMWTFHSISKDYYYVTATVNGSEKYLKLTAAGNCLLVDEPDALCEFKFVPGATSSQNAGKFQLKGSNNNIAYSGNLKGFIGQSTGVWLSFVEPSIYSEDDFVNYTAKKISVTDIQNGDEVIIYTRIWNDRTKEYEFYLVNHDGTLIRGYESGDDIVWISTKINTVGWRFFEYYYAGTNNPNYYYDFQNTYSEKYIAPQIGSSVITTDSAFGVNLNGRRYEDYYSTIIAWDDPYYDYAGLSVNSGAVASAPMSQATQFSFAVIRRPGELHEVNTVDHEVNGVTMKIIDFNGNAGQNACLGGSTTTQGTKPLQGLLSTNLAADGYPTSVITGQSLKTLFDGGTKVNHLFLESSYKNSGYYEFDSLQNFASLDGNNFKVYQELGTVDYVHGNTIKHGQFMPFNDLTPGVFCEINPKNLYDNLGNELSENNPRKGERLYKIPAENDPSPNAANFYFGMEIEASFVQPLDGHDDWGHDIVFEFTGDDDFWLYVDDELVLDLGGIHSAIPGTVNFSTGVVTCRDMTGKTITTSLYDIFKSNYEARGTMSAQEIDAALDDIFATKTINGTQRRVFKDYSAHTMRIFYMERGAGASNLKMRFNLAAVNPGQVQLSKEVEGTEKQDYISAKFPFQIHYSDGTNEHILYPNNDPDDPITVKYLNTSTDVEYLPSYTTEGETYQHVFFLKPKEVATIDFPADTVEYWITECGVKTNIYDTATINDEAPANITTHVSTNDYRSSRSSIKNRSKVVFKNHVNQNNLRALSITKRLFDESGNPLTAQQDATTFRFRLYLGETLDYYRLSPYHVKDPDGYYCTYSAGTGFVSSGYRSLNDMNEATKSACTFITSPSGAVDKIPADYTIEIRDLLVGTKFKVTEDSYEIPLGYGMRTWTETSGGITTTYTGYKRVEGSYIAEPGLEQNVGTIRDNNDPQIEIHNQRGFGLRVNKVWSDSSFILSHGYVYVAVFIGNSNTPIPGTVRRIDSYNYATYYFASLESGCTLSDYHVYEVALENVTIDANNNISYSSIRKLGVVDPDETFVVPDNVELDGTVAGDLTYKVDYQPGTISGTVQGIQNVRTDTVRNIRLGGLTVKKTSMNTSEYLSGAVFTLEDSNSVIGTYTSDQSGVVAILYLEDGTYTLTESMAPNGYQRLTDSFTITVQSGTFSVSGFESGNATYNTETSTLIVKNKPISFKIVKYDEENDLFLENAHFALYKEVQGIKAYYPLEGFEDIVSDENGVLSLINELLPPGTYYLTETQAPVGYHFPNPLKDVRFTKGSNGVITIDSSNSYTGTLSQSNGNVIAYTITVTNDFIRLEPIVLPATGSFEAISMTVFGCLLITFGILTITKRRKFLTKN